MQLTRSEHLLAQAGIVATIGFLFALLGGELWSWPTAKLLIKQAWKRGLRGLAGWMGEALRPTRAWLDSTYSSDLIQALWAPWALHTSGFATTTRAAVIPRFRATR